MAEPTQPEPTPPTNGESPNIAGLSPERLSDVEKNLLDWFDSRDAHPDKDKKPAEPQASSAEETPQVGIEGDGGAPRPVPAEEPATPAGQEPVAQPEPPPEIPPEIPPEPPLEAQEVVAPAAPVWGFTDQDQQNNPVERKFTDDELIDAVRSRDWVAQLRPEEVSTIDAALSGNYVLVPSQDLAALQQLYQQRQAGSGEAGPVAGGTPGAGPSPGPALGAPPPEPDFSQAVDPDMARQLHETQAQLAQVSAQQQQMAQQQMRDAAVVAARDGEADFLAQYPLTDDQLNRLRSATISSGVYRGLADANQGNHRLATKLALEHVYWATPEFRTQAIAGLTKESNDAVLAQQEADRQRQLQASALSGGSAPPPHEIPSVPETMAGRQEAAAQDIARALRGERTLAEEYGSG
jgi:hypothetical protein